MSPPYRLSKKFFLDIQYFDVLHRLLITGPLSGPDVHSFASLEIFRFVARTNKAARADMGLRLP